MRGNNLFIQFPRFLNLQNWGSPGPWNLTQHLSVCPRDDEISTSVQSDSREFPDLSSLSQKVLQNKGEVTDSQVLTNLNSISKFQNKPRKFIYLFMTLQKFRKSWRSKWMTIRSRLIPDCKFKKGRNLYQFKLSIANYILVSNLFGGNKNDESLS